MIILGVAGVTETDVRVAAVTVSVAVAVLPPKVAVITDAPGFTPVARPLFAKPLAFSVAVAKVPDTQTAVAVISADVPSE